MDQVSGIALTSGAEAGCIAKNALALGVEGSDFGALLAGLAWLFESAASNAFNNDRPLLPRTSSQQADGKGSFKVPGVLGPPETPGLVTVCQTGRHEPCGALLPVKPCCPGMEGLGRVAQGPAAAKLPARDLQNVLFRIQGLLSVEDAAGTQSASDAVLQAAGDRAAKEFMLLHQPVKDLNPALIKQPDIAIGEAKPVFEGQRKATAVSFSLQSPKAFAGTEHKGGDENPEFSLQDTKILPEESDGRLARHAALSDPRIADRPKAVTVSTDSEFRVRLTEVAPRVRSAEGREERYARVRLTEVAPRAVEQVIKDAETGWSREVPVLGRPERVPLEGLPQQFLREVTRRITDLRGHQGVVRLQLQLDPPGLGSVAVKLTLSEHKLKVHFYATDAEVKELLVATLPDLKAELGRMGLNLNEAHVFVGQEHGREPGDPPRREEGAQAPAVPLQAVEETALATEGINLLV
ncbi:MAG TPA: flagellar hook-length control protein FliK [Desulfotomaculum sp.]|nr:flagellar hook-length control protein FliK [Desulfotomaculum sp.]